MAEEEQKKYDAQLIRLKDCQSQLDTDDLDEEERKALAEVSKKGYYHARPKTQEAPSPPRISPEEVQHHQQVKSSTVRKRSTFDSFQQKWDKFDREEPDVKVVEEKKSTPVQRDRGFWCSFCLALQFSARTHRPDGRNEKEKADYLKRGVTRMAHHQSSDVTLRSERDELVDRITAAGNGSLMRGWRTTLDPEGELQVDYDDFCRVTGSWKWVGDINALFGGDGDLDHLQLSEIAPKEGKLMTNFMKWVKEEFGSPAGFFCALDANKKGKARSSKENDSSNVMTRLCKQLLRRGRKTSDCGHFVTDLSPTPFTESAQAKRTLSGGSINEKKPWWITRPQWENISKNLGPQYCAFLDLTEVELQGLFPFHFTLCIEALNYGDYFLKQEDQWEHVTQAKTGTLKVYSLGKMITGWNYGYSSFQETHFIRSSLDQPFPSVNRTMLCAAGMTYFGRERTQGSALHMVVENSVVVAYHKQGIVPQLFALFTSIGGYVTFLSIVFTSFFIKKYPESSVSEIYEARTLVFGSMWSRRKSDNETHVNFPEPLPLFSGLSKAVARHSFVSFCVNRSFKAAESDINRVFDCIDTGDIGFILKEDCIFLEVDPAIRYEERQRGGVVKEWKDRAAMEFLQHAKTGIRGLPGDSSSALPDRHRLAPRPWQAGAFEQIPMVVCQRRQEREREARFKQKFARATFLRQLRTAYGNEVRGLRRDVTPDGYMATLSDIRRYCRQAPTWDG
eukprot:symbB.v1.2.008047.t3/scaffold502.1/size262339/1